MKQSIAELWPVKITKFIEFFNRINKVLENYSFQKDGDTFLYIPEDPHSKWFFTYIENELNYTKVILPNENKRQTKN